jgi:hypothetical protein
MNLEDLHAMWAEDCIINESALDASSIDSARAHAKYLEIYSAYKLRLKRKEHEYAELRKDKWMYYNGKMTKAEMDTRGWPYDPFQGHTKPLKSDMEMFYETDADISKLKLVIEYQKTIVETAKEILDTLRWRHNIIRNILEHRRFMAGA